MRYTALLSGLLLVVGGLNWGLVGLFEYDLVAEVCGETFGSTNAVSRVIYLLVGVAAIIHVPALLAMLRGDRRGAESSRRDTVLNA